MAYPKRDLQVVPECNDEKDNPTLWAMKVCDNHYIWIAKYDEKDYRVENSDGHNLSDKVYKTMWGAKREAEAIAWRQEESGYFSD